MPRTNHPPAYHLHKTHNLAVVSLAGRDHYLGAYGSAESYEAYARLLAEWNASGKSPTPTQSGQKNEQGGLVLVQAPVVSEELDGAVGSGLSRSAE